MRLFKFASQLRHKEAVSQQAFAKELTRTPSKYVTLRSAVNYEYFAPRLIDISSGPRCALLSISGSTLTSKTL